MNESPFSEDGLLGLLDDMKYNSGVEPSLQALLWH
mgnify:CR=1 FL=1|jgi:hypothetical protein